MYDFILNMQNLPNVKKLGDIIDRNVEHFLKQRQLQLESDKKNKQIIERPPLMTTNDLLIDLIHVLNCSLNNIQEIEKTDYESVVFEHINHMYLSVGILACATLNDQIMHIKYETWNPKIKSTACEGSFAILIAEVVLKVCENKSKYKNLEAEVNKKQTQKKKINNTLPLDR